VINWDGIYARVITALGWTWEYIDEFLTLPRLNALVKHWQDFPPVNETVAVFVGVKSEKPKARKEVENAWQAVDELDEAAFKTLFAPKPGSPWVNQKLPG